MSHYFFIILIAVAIIRPYKIEFLPGLAIEILLTNAAIALTYAPFLIVYELIFPPKEDAPPAEGKDDKPEDE